MKHALRITRNKTTGAIRIWDSIKGQFVGKDDYGTPEKAIAARKRMEEKEMLESFGIRKVKGALGGTYYE